MVRGDIPLDMDYLLTAHSRYHHPGEPSSVRSHLIDGMFTMDAERLIRLDLMVMGDERSLGLAIPEGVYANEGRLRPGLLRLRRESEKGNEARLLHRLRRCRPSSTLWEYCISR